MLPLPFTWMVPRQVSGYPLAIRMSRTSWVTWIPSNTPVDSILEATFTALPQISYCGFRAPITPATTYIGTSSKKIYHPLGFLLGQIWFLLCTRFLNVLFFFLFLSSIVYEERRRNLFTGASLLWKFNFGIRRNFSFYGSPYMRIGSNICLMGFHFFFFFLIFDFWFRYIGLATSTEVSLQRIIRFFK